MRRGLLTLCFVAVFWNVENFFDFRQGREKKWVFYSKCEGIAKEMFRIADSEGELPQFFGLAEVENGFVVNQLIHTTLLRKGKYRYIHYDSPDHRGIDCALLYRNARLIGSKPCHIYDSIGRVMPTRDILLASFMLKDSSRVDVLVNHHPSKYGGKSDYGRRAALGRMAQVCDSLRQYGGICLSFGDFNEGPGYVVEGMTDLSAQIPGEGSIRFNGNWELIDRCYVSNGVKATMKVFADPQLSVKDAAHGGTKPRRTRSGPRYLGGISDHYPIVVRVN